MNLTDYMKLIAKVREHFREISPRAWELESLGQDIRAHFAARDVYLNEQETRLRDLQRQTEGQLEKLQQDTLQFTQKMADEQRERMRQVEEELKGKREQLDAEHKTRMGELEAREQKQKEREQEFDTRESKHRRRQLQQQMIDELKKLNVRRFWQASER